MRNFSSVVPASHTVAWFADKDLGEHSNYLSVKVLFNKLFENDPMTPFKAMTPSEQRVMADFLRYAKACRNRKSDYANDHPGSFVYINVNTGVSVVFVTWYGYGDYNCQSWNW